MYVSGETMLKMLDRVLDRWAGSLLVAARILLTILFLHEGVTLLFAFAPAAAAMARQGVPPPILAATIGLQLIAGAMILLGWHGRLGAIALGLFCLMTALLFHTNFQSQNELLHFEKDLAIAGGMLALAVLGTGRLSLDKIV
jgi:putative oxidoreductase